MYLQKMNLPCQHITEASTYITVHYRNNIHALRPLHGQRPTSDTLHLNGVYPCLAYSTCGMLTYETRGDTRRASGGPCDSCVATTRSRGCSRPDDEVASGDVKQSSPSPPPASSPPSLSDGSVVAAPFLPPAVAHGQMRGGASTGHSAQPYA
jgi:hypothetical protein